MNIVQDIITYIRRLIKTPSNESISDELLIDYINRFWTQDVDARLQLFDLKTTYVFTTTPGIDRYNMPMYDVATEPGGQNVSFYPIYQGFTGAVRVNGIKVPFSTQRSLFDNLWPSYVQQVVQAATGDGGFSYTINLPFFPIIPGHVDMAGIVATGINNDPILRINTLSLDVPVTSVNPSVFLVATGPDGQNIEVTDSGQFLSAGTNGDLYGLLMQPGKAPLGNLPLGSGINPNFYTTAINTINYNTGVINVNFNANIPVGVPIMAECYYQQQGLPRSCLFFNNVITLRSPPDKQYVVEMDAYLTPTAFLSTSAAVPFAYMSEYIARGAARKILSDTGDIEQFQFYEPLFKEQETLVWKRSQRQFTSTRTETIYSNPWQSANFNQSSSGL